MTSNNLKSALPIFCSALVIAIIGFAISHKHKIENENVLAWSGMYEVTKSFAIPVTFDSPFEDLEFSGHFTLTTVGSCGAPFQGDLDLKVTQKKNGLSSYIVQSNVPMPINCAYQMPGSCKIDVLAFNNEFSDWSKNQISEPWKKGFGDEKLPENQYVFSPDIDDSLPKPFLMPQPIYFYDLDNDEVLEIITPSLCNIRMNTLYQVHELEDLLEDQNELDGAEVAYSFLGNAVFDHGTRTMKYWWSNSTCEYDIVNYKFEKDRFVFQETIEHTCDN
ncbi:MAG: hypothetical protein ACON4I_02165 [Candidatus Puniceispirillaceae bacterium]